MIASFKTNIEFLRIRPVLNVCYLQMTRTLWKKSNFSLTQHFIHEKMGIKAQIFTRVFTSRISTCQIDSTLSLKKNLKKPR